MQRPGATRHQRPQTRRFCGANAFRAEPVDTDDHDMIGRRRDDRSDPQKPSPGHISRQLEILCDSPTPRLPLPQQSYQ
jgi:hypothetical protein